MTCRAEQTGVHIVRLDSCECRTHIVVVAMRAVLVALVILGHVLAKRLLALFAHEHHLGCPRESVRLRLGVTLCAIEPLLATWRTNRHLRVEDVFTARRIGQM